MTPRIEAKSLQDASKLICKALIHCGTVEVWIPTERLGYWARLKDVADLDRAARRRMNPQPYHVEIIPWDGFMYRGYHDHKPSSAF